MNVTSLAFGFVVGNASGLDNQRSLELGLVAAVSNMPPAQAALLTMVLARTLGPGAVAPPRTIAVSPNPPPPPSASTTSGAATGSDVSPAPAGTPSSPSSPGASPPSHEHQRHRHKGRPESRVLGSDEA